jgi:hypothetical protein
MPDKLPAGPYRIIARDNGTAVPFYVIPFYKQGRCEGPETRRHLVNAAKTGAVSNIFLFSHGWNNDWTVAIRRYEHFLAGYMNMRRVHQLPAPPGYKPLLVGVFWPSTALVFGEREEGPAIAAPDSAATDALVSAERAAVRELASTLEAGKVERFYDLAQKAELDDGEALELAEMLSGITATANDELGSTGALSARKIVNVHRAAAASGEEDEDFGTVGGGTGPRAASVVSALDPRHVIRTFTVWQMKDRAGTVGALGVGPLLRELLVHTAAKLPLIGHSYGAKVMLSAASFGLQLPRPLESMLLLQPAVSHLCFAANVPKLNRPGGYRAALERVVKPIFSTFSEHDFPLRHTFHLALRREDDLGEARIAAPGEPPSRYAPLGGYGPRGCGETILPVRDVNQPYPLPAGSRVCGIEASRTIGGHGDISNESTWWALYSHVKG